MLHDLKIIYVGSAGVLSIIPLRVLLRAGVGITAIAIMDETIEYLQQQPPTIADIRVGEEELLSTSASLLEIAEAFHIPVVSLSDLLKDDQEKLAALQPDLMLMSCFSRKLPAAIFQLPRLGCFNLHPSLLPAYRGPSPVHWQCVHKVQESGVTIHKVDAEFDRGDIAVQKKISTRHCLNKMELGYKLSLLGGEAFLDLLELMEEDQLILTPQIEAEASYYGFPD